MIQGKRAEKDKDKTFLFPGSWDCVEQLERKATTIWKNFLSSFICLQWNGNSSVIYVDFKSIVERHMLKKELLKDTLLNTSIVTELPLSYPILCIFEGHILDFVVQQDLKYYLCETKSIM